MGNSQKIIINADDFGLSFGVCSAIDQLMKINAISSTSVMMLSPDVCEYSNLFPYVFDHNKAGVHLQIPITGDYAYSYYQKDLYLKNIKFENDAINYDENLVYDIWDYQIKQFIRLFQQIPTHIDSHKGYHRLEKFREIYLYLAREYNVPVRGGEYPFSEHMKDYNVHGTTKFIRKWSGKGLPYGSLEKKLTEIRTLCNPDIDVIEVTCHPGHVDDEIMERSSLTYGRETDFEALLYLSENDWLYKNGFKMVSFNSLVGGSN